MWKVLVGGFLLALLGLGPAHAQTGCVVQTLPSILTSLSDNVAAAAITPQTIRNVVCSVGNFSTASSNYVMSNTNVSSNPSGIWRTGYSTPGDSPPMLYVGQSTPCSLNSGNGDGGSQIPSSGGGCWIAQLDPNGVDVREWGAKCDGATNDSLAFQNAVYGLGSLPGGHILRVPATGHSCYLATGIVLGNASTSGVSLEGVAGGYWPGYDDNTESDWTAFGSWIKCGDLVNDCITVSGNGSDMRRLNFWYTQPTPPGSNCGSTCAFTHDWTPINYPFTIGITNPQNFNHFSDINIINATNCIDMEGPSSGVGSFYTYFDHMQLGCFNTGMKFGKVDNAISVNDVKFLVLWYQAYNDVWGYMEGDTTVAGHKIDIDMYYLSDPAFNAVQFYQSYAAIRATTASVGSGLGTVTFAAQGLQFTNTVFNQVCQAFILSTSGGTNPIVNGDFTNTTINIDPQTSVIAGQCGQATPIAFNLNSDNVDLSFTNINGFEAQQLFNIGNGVSGGLHLSGRTRISYSAFTAAAPAIHVNSGAFLDMDHGLNNLFGVNTPGPQCSGACRNWPVVASGDTWVTGATGVNRQLLLATTTGNGTFQSRWAAVEDSSAETGNNVGTNFGIYRFSDAGAFLDVPIQVTRATGQVITPDGLAVTGGIFAPPVYTVATLPTCNGTTNVNTTAVVTNASSPTYLGVVAGGGGTRTAVLCNGTNWVSY